MNKKQLQKNAARFLLALLFISALAFRNPQQIKAASGTLTVTVNPGFSIALNWDDNAEGVLNYVVEKKTGDGSFMRIAYLPENASVYVDASNSAGVQDETYTYRILTYGYSTASHTLTYDYYSNEVTFRMSDISAPVSLTATPISGSQIDLAWTYPMNTSYTTLIERRDFDGGPWNKLAEVPSDTMSYQDTSLTPNKVYYYRIAAISGTSLKSATFPVDKAGMAGCTLLDAPQDFSGKAVSATRIDLSWADSTWETGFIIERRRMSEDFVPIRTVSKNTTVYHDLNLIPNTLYTYRIRALYNDSYRTNVSDYSQELSVIAAPINQPDSLKATLTEYGEIQLTWKSKVKFESGFEIWRQKDDQGGWFRIATVKRQERSYTDSTCMPGILYHYKIRSFIGINNDVSAYTPEVTAGSTDITAPDLLRYTISPSGGITINWRDNTSNETGYTVEYRNQPDQVWTVLAALPADSTRYVDTNGTPSGKNYYRIKAVNASYGGFSYSDELTVDAEQPELALTAVKSLSCSRIAIIWSDNKTDVLAYHIERSTNGGPVSEIAQTPANVKQFIDTGLSPSTKYLYRIKAVNSAGNAYYCAFSAAVTMVSPVFSDLEALGQYETAVYDLSSRGLFYADASSGFSPLASVTRADMVCWVVRAFSLDSIPVGSFTDVTASHPYYREIMTAKRYGLITAGKDGSFGPDDAMTREDACELVVKTLQLLGSPLPNHLISDIEEYADYEDINGGTISSVASCIGEAVLPPAQGNLIAPAQPLSRIDAVMMIYLVIDRLPFK